MVRFTIPDIIKALNELDDIEAITKYENILNCMIASPLMLIGTLANFIFRYLIWHEEIHSILFDSIFLFTLFIAFEILMRIKLRAGLVTHAVSILYVSWFIFIFLKFYPFVGPAVWTVSFIQLLLSMTRIKKIMVFYIGGTIVSAGIYMLFTIPEHAFVLSLNYYVIQSIVLIILFVVTNIVHKISLSRYLRIRNQLGMVVSQRDEITSLFEEIAATEEELRQQNEQLSIYNTQIVNDEKRLKFMAYYDMLTELPNRKMVLERLNLLIQTAKKQAKHLYIVFIDIDNFKKINDTMGHHLGDLFIHAAAARLERSAHKNDLLGRIGGDEFALVIQRELDEEEAFLYVESIREIFSEPFLITHNRIRSSASFGISIFPKDGVDAIELMKNADASMYKAKELGKNNIQFYKKELQEELVKKINMENRLISAFQNDEFFLVFQPQYDLGNNKIRGFEALIRWKSPELGIISPMQFIPLAEEIGLIIPLGEWILNKACKEFAKLQQKYNMDAIISVNISAVQIKDEQFIEIIRAALNNNGLKPESLELEITESVLIESVNQTILIINDIKKMGVGIALDDFGTGYSSLSYLKLLPINLLKIDKTFLDDLAINVPSKKIIGDIISLAHNLDILVLAEGVEYKHQLDYLNEHGCDFAQGFLLGVPVERDALYRLLENKYNK